MKTKILFSIISFLIISTIIFFIIKNQKINTNISLPTGYTLDDYEIAKVTDIPCTRSQECTTPGEYLVRSNCPYTSLCLKNKCNVVCPSHKIR